MRLSALRGVAVALPLALTGCTSRHGGTAPAVPAAQTAKADVSRLVPADFSYAKDFVQLLNDSGWSVRAVRRSNFESFFRETHRAAYIETDKGVLEAVFFDSDDEVEQIRVGEEPGRAANYHEYVVRTPETTRRIGGAPFYFAKRGNVFITALDPKLCDALNRL